MKNGGVGKVIRVMRKSKNLSQAELGEKLGYSARTVSDWENVNTEPNVAAIKAIVAFFEISYEEFFEET